MFLAMQSMPSLEQFWGSIHHETAGVNVGHCPLGLRSPAGHAGFVRARPSGADGFKAWVHLFFAGARNLSDCPPTPRTESSGWLRAVFCDFSALPCSSSIPGC
jgi:hypothetical protein